MGDHRHYDRLDSPAGLRIDARRDGIVVHIVILSEANNPYSPENVCQRQGSFALIHFALVSVTGSSRQPNPLPVPDQPQENPGPATPSASPNVSREKSYSRFRLGSCALRKTGVPPTRRLDTHGQCGPPPRRPPR